MRSFHLHWSFIVKSSAGGGNETLRFPPWETFFFPPRWQIYKYLGKFKEENFRLVNLFSEKNRFKSFSLTHEDLLLDFFLYEADLLVSSAAASESVFSAAQAQTGLAGSISRWTQTVGGLEASVDQYSVLQVTTGLVVTF